MCIQGVLDVRSKQSCRNPELVSLTRHGSRPGSGTAQGNTSTCTELRSNQFESLLTRAEDVRGLTSDAARQSGLTSESFKACGASNTLGSVWWERVGLEVCFQKILIMYVYDTICYSHVSVHHLTNWTLHRDVLCGSFGTFGSKTHFPENQQS